MTETKIPNTPDKSFPRWLKNLEPFLFFLGLVGLLIALLLPEIPAFKPVWLALLMILGLYVGPLISLVFEYFNLSHQKPLPFSLKLVIGIFILLSLSQLYRFVLEIFTQDTYGLGKLLMSILYLNLAFGLAKLERGWWITGIFLACLPLVIDVFLLITRFEILNTVIWQLIFVGSQILIFLSMLVILLLPQTRKLFQKPALSPQSPSA